MWKRRLSSQLRTLMTGRSTPELHRFAARTPSPYQPHLTVVSRHFASASAENVLLKKRLEDLMPIATGHEREEIEAELQGRRILDINYPEGPFGTKGAPAIVKSSFDKRIVGCPGGEGEDEHDVVWFWLEKGKPHECPVCTQYFMLDVIGPGGPPPGHGDDEHH